MGFMPHGSSGSSGRVRRLVLVLAAVAGVVAAHGLEYTAAHVDPVGRSHHLHVTGHGYWPGAVRVAIAAAVLAMGVAAGSGIRRALDRSEATAGRGGPPSPALRLAPLALVQVALFGAIEITERVVAGADLAELVQTPWFAAGVALQVVVAAVAVVVLRLIGAGVERILAHGRRPRLRREPAVRPVGASRVPGVVVARASGCRGPPVVLLV